MSIPIGRAVICDVCNEDWTDSDRPGGFIICGYATCPDCASRWGDLHARPLPKRVTLCPVWESFADFIRRVRGPDAAIEISSAERRKEEKE